MRKAVPFHRLVSEAAQHGLLNEEDCAIIRSLIDALDEPITSQNVQEILDNYSASRAAAGYYYQYFKRQARGVETMLDSKWLGVYDSIRTAKYDMGPQLKASKEATPGGRFSEKLVSAKIHQDPTYVSLRKQHETYEYFAAQAFELKISYERRAGMLEQWANNARLLSRLETE